MTKKRFVSVEAVSRFHAIMWTVHHLGVPTGFRDFWDYEGYVNIIMDTAEFEEEYIVDSTTGNLVAYFTWCVSNDIHHKGDIMDVTNLVIDPEFESRELHRFLSGRFKELAELNGLQWVSRCKHDSAGIMKVYFKEV